MKTLKLAPPESPLEKEEGYALMRAVRSLEHLEPRLELLFHVPNGGWRAQKTAREFQGQGVKPGVPDYCLPVPMLRHAEFGEDYVCHGLWVELKRTKGGQVSENQAWWHRRLTQMGYAVCVAKGWYLALCYILAYLDRDDLIKTLDPR